MRVEVSLDWGGGFEGMVLGVGLRCWERARVGWSGVGVCQEGSRNSANTLIDNKKKSCINHVRILYL